MEKNIFQVTDQINLRQRTEYAQSIEKFLNGQKEKSAAVREKFIHSADRETLRADYIKMLGFPLTCAETFSGEIAARYEYLGADDDFLMNRVQLEVLPDFWFYGILYTPRTAAEKCALVIAQHGGGGTAEIVGSLEKASANYNHMARRINRGDVIIFAPQLLLWSDEYGKGREDRERYGRELLQLGGSMTALEIFCIRRCIDYFSALDNIDPQRIGMIGLSYGGMYALCTAAADVRIKSTLSSCFFNDRFEYNWPDFIYREQANTFFDAETAALIYPRALYVEDAAHDGLFQSDSAKREAERLFRYVKDEKPAANFQFKVFEGAHELNPQDSGIEFFLKNL